MYLGTVVGEVVSTHKNERLVGKRLLLVKKRGPKKAIVPAAALSARVAGQIPAAS